MPKCVFIGEINNLVTEKFGLFSITYHVIPGNECWSLQSGQLKGATMTNSQMDGTVVFNHPIDSFFSSTSVEGWPYIVCEVWCQSSEGVKEFFAAGCSWLPFCSGNHLIEINVWRILSLKGKIYSDSFLPDHLNLRDLGEVMLNPSLRKEIISDSMGVLSVNLNVALSGFHEFGMQV